MYLLDCAQTAHFQPISPKRKPRPAPTPHLNTNANKIVFLTFLLRHGIKVFGDLWGKVTFVLGMGLA